LLTKQIFHQLAAGGKLALHLTYWMGAALQDRLPLPEGAIFLTGKPPAQFVALQTLLLEACDLPSVNPAFLEATKSALIYRDWMTDTPPPTCPVETPSTPLGPHLAEARHPCSASNGH
jgi:hypothetical protein